MGDGNSSELGFRHNYPKNQINYISLAPPWIQFLTSPSKPIFFSLQLPADLKFNFFDAEGNMQEITVGNLTKGKKVVLFAVPGAFTPTCSLKHLPGFIEKADELKGKGVDTIACVSVNDAFVMDAWGKSVGADGKILMLADGSAVFAKAIGAELDLNDKGLGVRSRRYAMLVDDGAVKVLNLEEGGAFTVSSADDILSAL
jgi:peroxiredoxin